MIHLASLVASHRLADELRAEQETAMLIERDRKLLECQVFYLPWNARWFPDLRHTLPQVKDAQTRLDEAEQTALRGGKKAVAKMETRIRELESELDSENRRFYLIRNANSRPNINTPSAPQILGCSQESEEIRENDQGIDLQVCNSVALSHFSVPFQKVSKGKDYHHRLDEDGKNQQRMESLVEQLQAKIKSYKKQIEEAEEIAALNLAKYRQVNQL